MIECERDAEIEKLPVDRLGQPAEFLGRRPVQPFEQARKNGPTISIALILAKEPVGIIVFKQSVPRADSRLPCINENLPIALTTRRVQRNGVALRPQLAAATFTATVRSPVVTPSRSTTIRPRHSPNGNPVGNRCGELRRPNAR